MGRALGFVALLVFCAAVARPGPEEWGHPLVTQFSPRDYQADPLCQAVIQGADGVIYVANNVNLLAYDGATWRLIKLAEGKGTGTVRQFARAADGTIYLGGGGLLGVLRDREGTMEYVPLLGDGPAAEPRACDVFQVVAQGDSVFFTESDAIHVWRGGRLATIPCPAPAGPRGPRVHPVGDALYVTAFGEALRRLVDGRLERVVDDPVFRENFVVAIEPSPAPAGGGARVFLTAERGWFELRDGRVTPWATPMNVSLAGKRVRSFVRSPDGSAAVSFATASGNGGMLFGADGKFRVRLDESIGLRNRALRDFCPDTEGGLWIGLESGVARLEWPALFTAFDAVNGLGLGFVSDFVRHDGALYASTLEGVYRLTPGDGVTKAARFEQVFNLPVYCLLSHPTGLLAYGYTQLFQQTAAGFVPRFDSPPTMGALRTSRVAADRVWLTTSHGLRSIRHTADGWRDEGFVPGTEDNDGTFGESADGTLWMISPRHGVLRLGVADAVAGAGGAWAIERFPAGTAGVPAYRRSHITHAGGEPMFSFDSTATVFRFDAQRRRFIGLPGTEALPAENLEVGWASSDSLDPAGETQWLANSSAPLPIRALFGVPRGGGAIRVMPHVIVDSVSRIWRMRVEQTAADGVLWICSANGLIRVDPRLALPPPTPYAAKLWSASVRAGETLPAARRNVEFEFTAPRFRTGAAPVFQTRLDGYASAWSPWSADRKRSFTNLAGGRYRFEVRARDSDGVFSAPALMAFTVLPPWWRTWWFIGLASVSGIGAVAGVTRWYSQRVLKRRLALLEAQSGVERERLRLARDLHDEVGSGLGRVILFAEEAEREIDDRAQLTASLGRMRDSAKDLVQHAREIVWAVSPQHDTLASVIERLGDYVEETLRAAGIECAMAAPSPEKIPPVSLGSEARHSLFLAVKEAVHNCVKYSGAKTAEFRLAIEGNDFVVTLRDHGRGFAAGEIAVGGTGHGLPSLAARAESLGGRADIASVLGQGTTVTLRVALVKA